MKFIFLAFALPIVCAAQQYPSWTILDTTGGEGAQYNDGSHVWILEEQVIGFKSDGTSPLYSVYMFRVDQGSGTKVDVCAPMRTLNGSNCSCGDPGTDVNGNAVVLVQNSSYCTNTNYPPKTGQGHEIWAFKGPLASGWTMNGTTNGLKVGSITSTVQGYWDPSMQARTSTLSDIFSSHRITGTPVLNKYNHWAVDFSSSAPTLSATISSDVLLPGQSSVTSGCDSYAKPGYAVWNSSLSQWTVFVSATFGSETAWGATTVNASLGTCGANGERVQSALMYSFTETTGGTISNYARVWPPSGWPLATPAGTPRAYCEWTQPILLSNGHQAIYMNSASHSSDYIVDLCFSTSGCQGNFTSNQLIIDLATNQVWQLTNFFDQGSALNLAFMSGPNFGGTARVSYDPTAKTILTNVQNSLINYTVLWPLSFQGSPVNFQATFGGTTTARGSTTIR